MTDNPSPIIAAIDMGSNSFHFCVARRVKDQIQQVYSFKQRVRLAEGMDDDGNLCPQAMERGLECLNQFADKLAELEVDQTRAVATFALRQAPNREDFVDEANRILPCEIEVVPGVEEARLIFQGVRLSQHIDRPSLVIDIGGGSTEFIIGGENEPQMLHSEAMGCVSFQQYFFSKEISKRQFKKAILRAERQMHPFVNAFKHQGWDKVIGTSGTVKAIMNLCLNQADDQSRLTDEHLKQLQQDLCDDPQQLLDAGLDPERLRVLPGGLAVLRGIFSVFKIEAMEFSPAALREGVISEMLHPTHIGSVANHTVDSLRRLYHVDQDHADNVSKSLAYLISGLKIKVELQQLLFWAAQLHEIGIQLNPKGFQRHSGYILSEANMRGFNLEQQQVLAWLVSHHRKNLKNLQKLDVRLASNKQLMQSLIALRIACLLHLGHTSNHYPVTLTQDGEHMHLGLPPELYQNELLMSELVREQHYLKVVNWSLSVEEVD
ncbi:Ppx/GppA phosphatase family protein [Paraferrimonas sedimenticola]|uniref:Exopolyphosphatase n=1 Tax=Paraferrimonas sedimenticola TaxID=375674 RepID=A0AA37VXA6_9GAMM|nr:Ppx/GppA phosphatase family protein [Paraferrimonas sedimenticola]GLP95215.1 exopolyphosphatase [Paraferrimonas sedimenticola]